MKMVSRKISAIYIAFLVFFSVFSFTLFLLFLYIPYDQLISRVTQSLKKPELESLIRHHAFPVEKFLVLQNLARTCLILLPLLVYVLYKTRSLILGGIYFTLQTIRGGFRAWKQMYRMHSLTEKRVLFFILLLVSGRSLYYIITKDLQYDEMWSYNYFTAAPFYFSFFMYNNYPLYELITHCFHWLPFPQKINLRLPVFLGGIAACMVFYYYLYQLFKNQSAAVLGIFLFVLMPPVTAYMLYGRGVIFEILFAIPALFSMLKWLDSPEKNEQALIFIMANILGIYSMPSHIYFWICLFLLAVFSRRLNKSMIRNFIYMNTWILLGTFLLYSPVLLGSGFSFLISVLNPVVKTNWSQLPALLGSLGMFITGFRYGLWVLIIPCLSLLAIRKRFAYYHNLILACLILSVLPVLFYALQRILIPTRALAFLSLVLPLTAGVIWNEFAGRSGKKIQFAILALSGIGAAEISHSHNAINWSNQLDRHVVELSLVFLNNGISSCYDSCTANQFGYFYPGLEYYYRQEGRTIRLNLGNPKSLRYKPYSNADSYDCIVRDTDSSPTISGGKEEILYRWPERGFEVVRIR